MSTTPTKAYDRPSLEQARAWRVAAALGGGYAFVWGFSALGTVLGVAAGMPYEEARQLASLLSFVVYLVAFCWAFSVKRALVAWLVLLGGGAFMTALAWHVARALA
jgi:hypothetical protein